MTNVEQGSRYFAAPLFYSRAVATNQSNQNVKRIQASKARGNEEAEERVVIAGNGGVCHRRFDGIVKINERIPGSSKMSRASIFLARRPICNCGGAFFETVRRTECGSRVLLFPYYEREKSN